MWRMYLDHLSYVAGAEGLGACAQRLGSRLGGSFADGGLHPRFGTRNFVLPLAADCYLEVVAPLDHPAADQAPFGRAVAARSATGGGWLAWAVRVDDIGSVEQRLGRASAPGHRRRPDGVDLTWRQIGINDVAVDPQLPFFLQWDVSADHHPSAGGTDITLVGLTIAGDESAVDTFLGTSSKQPLDGIDVEWVAPTGSGTGVLSATFTTPYGAVTLD